MKIENLIPLRIQRVFIAHASCHVVLKHLSCVKKKIFLAYQGKNISNSSNEGFFDLLEEKYLSNLLKSHIPTKSLIRLPKAFVPELNAWLR